MWSVVTLSPRIGQHAGVGDVLQWLGLARQALEERRLAHVGRALVPGEAVSGRHLERVPALVAVEHLAVALVEHVGLHGVLDRRRDLLGLGPDVAQVHRLSVAVLAERLVVEVDVHRPGQRVGDAQRRRGEVVHLHVGIDPPLEVAVARQHRDHGQVLGADDVGDLLGQGTAVADAGRAAVADEVEAQLVEVFGQPGPFQVLGDHLGAGSQRGLDPRLDLQPLLDGVAGQQPGAEHHRRVGGVGAAGDRGDHDVAVVELGLGPVGQGHRRARARVGRRPARLRSSRAVPRPGRASRWSRGRRRRGSCPRRPRRCSPPRGACPPAPSGTRPWPRSGTRGPGGAWARRCSARPRTRSSSIVSE